MIRDRGFFLNGEKSGEKLVSSLGALELSPKNPLNRL
jgi:hypothetical protein